MDVKWRLTALGDIERIVRHIANENPRAASEIARALLEAGDSLALFPRRGRLGLAAGTLELVIVRPYIIVYEVDDPAGEVNILRVWHSSRG